mgnify:CR=1 FL=1
MPDIDVARVRYAPSGRLLAVLASTAGAMLLLLLAGAGMVFVATLATAVVAVVAATCVRDLRVSIARWRAMPTSQAERLALG